MLCVLGSKTRAQPTGDLIYSDGRLANWQACHSTTKGDTQCDSVTLGETPKTETTFEDTGNCSRYAACRTPRDLTLTTLSDDSQRLSLMRLYHTTPRSNLENIQRDGLDPTRSRGKWRVSLGFSQRNVTFCEPKPRKSRHFPKGAEMVIWLHTPSRTHWAILHTAKRHHCNIDDIIIIEVNIPRAKIRRRWRGLWTTDLKITAVGRGFLCEGFQRKRYHFVLPFRLNKMLAPPRNFFKSRTGDSFRRVPSRSTRSRRTEATHPPPVTVLACYISF